MRDMLHDRRGKRKAETGAGIEVRYDRTIGLRQLPARCLLL